VGAVQQGVPSRQGAKGRHWADVVAIFTGLALLGLAIWPGPQSASAGAARESGGNQEILWLAHAAAGALALGSVAIAQRWNLRAIARGMLAVAAVGLVVVCFTFRDFGPRALLTLVLPAMLLLVSAFAVGPMPREL
jgi:hypothetical protein